MGGQAEIDRKGPIRLYAGPERDFKDGRLG